MSGVRINKKLCFTPLHYDYNMDELFLPMVEREVLTQDNKKSLVFK